MLACICMGLRFLVGMVYVPDTCVSVSECFLGVVGIVREVVEYDIGQFGVVGSCWEFYWPSAKCDDRCDGGI